MKLPLVYHDAYSPPFPAQHRFPMENDHLVESGLSRDETLLHPGLCPNEILTLAHCPAYIECFASGELAHEAQRRQGLDTVGIGLIKLRSVIDRSKFSITGSLLRLSGR